MTYMPQLIKDKALKKALSFFYYLFTFKESTGLSLFILLIGIQVAKKEITSDKQIIKQIELASYDNTLR